MVIVCLLFSFYASSPSPPQKKPEENFPATIVFIYGWDLKKYRNKARMKTQEHSIMER